MGSEVMKGETEKAWDAIKVRVGVRLELELGLGVRDGV